LYQVRLWLFSVSLTLFRVVYLVLFVQVDDGIRDRNVTGVQTCALPISQGVLDLGEVGELAADVVGAPPGHGLHRGVAQDAADAGVREAGGVLGADPGSRGADLLQPDPPVGRCVEHPLPEGGDLDQEPAEEAESRMAGTQLLA